LGGVRRRISVPISPYEKNYGVVDNVNRVVTSLKKKGNNAQFVVRNSIYKITKFYLYQRMHLFLSYTKIT